MEQDTMKRERRFCPRCGPGVFLAEHEDRFTCGRCRYTEFKKKKKPETQKIESSAEEKAEEKPSEKKAETSEE